MSDNVPVDPSKKVIKSERSEPCGCHVIEFSDGGGQLSPCVPHAMERSGRAMQAASTALAEAAQFQLIAGKRLEMDRANARPSLSIIPG